MTLRKGQKLVQNLLKEMLPYQTKLANCDYLAVGNVFVTCSSEIEPTRNKLIVERIEYMSDEEFNKILETQQ